MDPLEEIEEEIRNCKKCDLWKSRKNPVVGEGSTNAEILLIGEAPGYWEDVKGKPFVGKAGQFLNELLASIGLKRKEIYITNILKCRPPNNRNPLRCEIQACTPYLDRQIEYINPKVIITLGNFATSYILNKYGFGSEPIGKIHGRIYRDDKVIIPMYHPATAVYNPRMKKTLLEDFKILARFVKACR